jgi:hypothetical protein
LIRQASDSKTVPPLLQPEPIWNYTNGPPMRRTGIDYKHPPRRNAIGASRRYGELSARAKDRDGLRRMHTWVQRTTSRLSENG